MTSDSTTTLQSTILRLLLDPNVDKRLGRGEHYFTEAVIKAYSQEKKPASAEITQTLWYLLGRGLVYIYMWQHAPENWEWQLTKAGIESAKDEQFNPDDLDRYLLRLRANVLDVSDLVFLYAK